MRSRWLACHLQFSISTLKFETETEKDNKLGYFNLKLPRKSNKIEYKISTNQPPLTISYITSHVNLMNTKN
jgi:hypothetical protein